jgi:glycosyltransferase involved in cell wall biosynthesis
VPRLLAAFDVFVHPSREDPCPLSLLEGLAAGRPTIAYAEGGALELIRDGETGLLAPAGDTRALGRAMSELLSDVALRERLGSAARASIERDFTPESRGRSYSRVVGSLAAS